MPRQHTPTPEQRDERVNTELPADELIRRVLTAPPPKDEKKKPPKDS